jgi:hypothetical protein
VLCRARWQQEPLAVRAGDGHFVAGLEVAEIVARDAEKELFGFVVLVDQSLDGGREHAALAIFAAGRRCD